MTKKIKYLGLIPARGGSKRVPRKNIIPVNGKPLLFWSIDAAFKSKKIDNIIVSTEDSTIKHFAGLYGVNIINRPPELANDITGLTGTIKHALKTIPAENVVVLRPTSPIRIQNIIDVAIEEFEQTKADSLMTGFINKEYEWFTRPDAPSQSLEGWFQGDGCVEIHKASVFESDNSYGKICNKCIIPELYNHEIDTEIDLVMVEALMKYLEIKG